MSDCVFCSIVSKQLPATELYRDEQIVAFVDKFPKAPLHLLVVPTEHLDSLHDATENHAQLIGKMTLKARDLAIDAGYQSFKLVWNTGAEAGMVIHHLHLHVLAGKKMGHI